MKLEEIKTEPKTGQEKFTLHNEELNFNVLEFWSWNQSDLIENRTRGILAEYIVKQALEIKSSNRTEWDDYDLISNSGKKIEVKSAAYIQSWSQKQFSSISFNISPSKRTEDRIPKRLSDFYVFCLLKHKNQETINPLNLNQWVFYVVKTTVLDKFVPNQKTISLSSLLKLEHEECKYNTIKKII